MGNPRCSRIALTPPAPFTYANTRRLPPHLKHANTARANVLRSSPAQFKRGVRSFLGSYGRARELVEAKLRVEAARLDDAEAKLRALENDAENLELMESQREWFVGALRNFRRVWSDMTPENQGRLLRALVANVSVDEETGVCRVELVNFDAATGAKEAA